MKTKQKIFIAFLLNLVFSIFELFGGIITGSVAIASDAVHDFGDAISIGMSYFLEKISNKKSNKIYTYGYARYSVLGGLLTTFILLIGSVIVMYNAILRIITPTTINYNRMIVFAVVGLLVNLLATYFTHGGNSINQRAVNLHMLEDVLGWLVVLIGAVIMRFTNLYIIDPILSIIVALFIIVNCFKNLKQILDIFLIKTPKNIEINKLIEHVKNIDGVFDVHHVHVWSLDEQINCATLHIVVGNYNEKIKNTVKLELKEHGISHICVEIETNSENCEEKFCEIERTIDNCHEHHCQHHH